MDNKNKNVFDKIIECDENLTRDAAERGARLTKAVRNKTGGPCGRALKAAAGVLFVGGMFAGAAAFYAAGVLIFAIAIILACAKNT